VNRERLGSNRPRLPAAPGPFPLAPLQKPQGMQHLRLPPAPVTALCRPMRDVNANERFRCRNNPFVAARQQPGDNFSDAG
jgi:hypothetical protein